MQRSTGPGPDLQTSGPCGCSLKLVSWLRGLVHGWPLAIPSGIMCKVLWAYAQRYFLGRRGSAILTSEEMCFTSLKNYIITQQYWSWSFSCYTEEAELIVSFP